MVDILSMFVICMRLRAGCLPDMCLIGAYLGKRTQLSMKHASGLHATGHPFVPALFMALLRQTKGAHIPSSGAHVVNMDKHH